MADIVGEPIPDYVAKQIDIRQKAHGSGANGNRTPEQITYLNSRTAWVKLASGVKITSERLASEKLRSTLSNTTLAQQFILFGGTARRVGESLQTRSTLLNQDSGKYNVTARSSNSFDFGLVPMPGIESVEIKAKNRGSIREATVKLKVYDKDQFDIIDLLYLRLGYTVLLEWGDSIYLNNNGALTNMGHTLIEDQSSNGFFNFDGTHTQYVKIIEGYRRGKNGNYDGLLAKVKNFEWSFAQDGSYDVTLSLISVGDVIESLKSNITPPKVLTDFLNIQFPPEAKTKEEEEDTTQSAGTIESSAKDNIISAYMLYWKIILKLNYENGLDYVENPNEITYENESGLNPIGVFPKPSEIGESTDFFSTVQTIQDQTFVETAEEVFGEVPAGDKDICYFNYNNGEDYEIFDPGFYWRFGSFLDFIKTQCVYKNNKTNTPAFDIDTDIWSNRMIYYPYQISFDPRVCVVNGSISDYKVFPQLFPWKNENRGFAWIMSIYVSFTKIQECINSNKDEEGNVALIPLLESICTAINEALGGINNLEPIMDESTNTLRIIDDSYSKDKKQPSYALEMYGYNGSTSNFVRQIDLKTTITPEYANMVTIGATAGGYVKGTEATMFSKFNDGLIDRFKEKYIPANKTTAENPDEARDSYFQSFFNVGELSLGYKLAVIGGDISGDMSPQLMDDVIDNNKSIATEYYKYLNAKAQQANKAFAGPTLGFIPFSLGLTMDGISGIKIYNEINVDTRFLPKKYPDNLRFIIKGVNHKLSNQDWETSIETMVIPNTLDKKPSYDLLLSLVKRDSLERVISLIPFGFGEGERNRPPRSSSTTTTNTVPERGNDVEIKLEDIQTTSTTPLLEKYTRAAAIDRFGSRGRSGESGLCGGYTFRMAWFIAQKLRNKKLRRPGGNDADSPTIRENLNALGVYREGSMNPVLSGVSFETAKKQVEAITQKALYGEVVLYFATPVRQKNPSGEGRYRFHAQIFTGDAYTNGRFGKNGNKRGKWSSSWAANYGYNFVYSDWGPWTIYWFRFKDEYRK
jgi:hypothetical protein